MDELHGHEVWSASPRAGHHVGSAGGGGFRRSTGVEASAGLCETSPGGVRESSADADAALGRRCDGGSVPVALLPPLERASLRSPAMTAIVGLVQSDSVVLASDTRVVYGNGAVHDRHRKILVSRRAMVAFAGPTDVAEACADEAGLPSDAGAMAVGAFLGRMAEAQRRLVGAPSGPGPAVEGIVAGFEDGDRPVPRLWTFGPPTWQAAPSTVGVASVGVAAPVVLAVGGQLHRSDLGPEQAAELAAFLVALSARCFAAVDGWADVAVVHQRDVRTALAGTEGGDGAVEVERRPLEPAGAPWAGRLSALFAPWTDPVR